MKYKNTLLLIAFFILLAIGLLYLRPIPTVKGEVIRVGYNPQSLNHAPIMVGIEKDFFNKRGVRVEFIPMNGSKEVKQGLASGSIDIGLAGSGNFYLLVSKGVPVKIITTISFSPSYVMVRANELVSFKDMEGKRIADNPTGSSANNLLSVMQAEGVDIKKAKFVDIDTELKILALMNQKVVDIVPVDDVEYEQYLKAGAIVLPEWITKGYSNKNVARTSVAVNTAFLDSQEVLIRLFLDGLTDSLDFIENNPHDAAQLVAAYMNKESLGVIEFTSEEIEKEWQQKTVIYSAAGNPTQLEKEATMAYEIGVLEKKITLQNFYDSRFATKLEAAEKNIYGKTE